MVTTIKFTKMQGAGNDYIYVNTLKAPSCPKTAYGERAGRRSNSGHGSSPACQLQTNKYPGRQNVGKNNHSRWKRIQKNICLYVKSTFSGFHR